MMISEIKRDPMIQDKHFLYVEINPAELQNILQNLKESHKED